MSEKMEIKKEKALKNVSGGVGEDGEEVVAKKTAGDVPVASVPSSGGTNFGGTDIDVNIVTKVQNIKRDMNIEADKAGNVELKV